LNQSVLTDCPVFERLAAVIPTLASEACDTLTNGSSSEKGFTMDGFAVSFPRGEVPRFSCGNLAITPNAKASLLHEDVLTALKRHLLGDWGDLERADLVANDVALRNGERLLSAYTSATGVRFWIITEADRSYTTILLPEDY
jgi:hypothetical protein